jgi:hypothetical protein
MPPQQAHRLLDLIDRRLDFRAHLSLSVRLKRAEHREDSPAKQGEDAPCWLIMAIGALDERFHET